MQSGNFFLVIPQKAIADQKLPEKLFIPLSMRRQDELHMKAGTDFLSEKVQEITGKGHRGLGASRLGRPRQREHKDHHNRNPRNVVHTFVISCPKSETAAARYSMYCRSSSPWVAAPDIDKN